VPNRSRLPRAAGATRRVKSTTRPGAGISRCRASRRAGRRTPEGVAPRGEPDSSSRGRPTRDRPLLRIVRLRCVSEDLTGRRLGKYKIESVLGRGGMSVMYRATDMTLGRKVALKVMAGHLGQDPEFRERFVDEARNTSAIDH